MDSTTRSPTCTEQTPTNPNKPQQAPPTTPPDQITPQPNGLRAAHNVRMSTEHQQYSTNNQADKILEYAQRRNIEIVRTYARPG